MPPFQIERLSPLPIPSTYAAGVRCRFRFPRTNCKCSCADALGSPGRYQQRANEGARDSTSRNSPQLKREWSASVSSTENDKLMQMGAGSPDRCVTGIRETDLRPNAGYEREMDSLGRYLPNTRTSFSRLGVFKRSASPKRLVHRFLKRTRHLSQNNSGLSVRKRNYTTHDKEDPSRRQRLLYRREVNNISPNLFDRIS